MGRLACILLNVQPSEKRLPHMNFQYKTSIEERLIFYIITRCYSNGQYFHLFAIAAGYSRKYQYGHMMRKADAHTVPSGIQFGVGHRT